MVEYVVRVKCCDIYTDSVCCIDCVGELHLVVVREIDKPNFIHQPVVHVGTAVDTGGDVVGETTIDMRDATSVDVHDNFATGKAGVVCRTIM